MVQMTLQTPTISEADLRGVKYDRTRGFPIVLTQKKLEEAALVDPLAVGV